jgi:hypothetical protein
MRASDENDCVPNPTFPEVVVSSPFSLFLLHNHIINKKKSFSGDVNYEANFSFLFLLHRRANPILPPYLLPHSPRELKPYTPPFKDFVFIKPFVLLLVKDNYMVWHDYAVIKLNYLFESLNKIGLVKRLDAQLRFWVNTGTINVTVADPDTCVRKACHMAKRRVGV